MNAPDRDKLADAIDALAAPKALLNAALAEYLDGRHECSARAGQKALEADSTLMSLDWRLRALWSEVTK